MKRILVLLFFVIVLVSSCSNGSQFDEGGSISNIGKTQTVGDVFITEIERFDIQWDEIELSFDLNENVLKEIKPIETNSCAVEIAENIIEDLNKEGKLSEYTLVSIIHSREENLWCFEYTIDQKNKDADDLIDGGCLYVAIDGNEGALIKAWCEE